MINFNDAINNIYQITFRFPDKHKPIKEQRYNYAKLSRKIVNPENLEDYAWETVDETLAKCKHNIITFADNHYIEYGDMFTKYKGRKEAFTKLINRNFDRELRKSLWFLFFDKYGRK